MFFLTSKQRSILIVSQSTELINHSTHLPIIAALVVCLAIWKSLSEMGPAVCSHSPYGTKTKKNKKLSTWKYKYNFTLQFKYNNFNGIFNKLFKKYIK